MRTVPPATLTAALLLGGCQLPSMPEDAGRGLLSHDSEPPAGATVHERPAWQVGDRFVYRRGALLRMSFTVETAGEAGYELRNEESGVRARYDVDFGEVGERHPDDPLRETLQQPADAVLHWPLWVGKRWSNHFVRKSPGAPVLPLITVYEVADEDTVTVPAGTFECLRIERRARVAAEGRFLERVTLLWYSPKVGAFVRRLESGTLVELEEYQRQG